LLAAIFHAIQYFPVEGAAHVQRFKFRRHCSMQSVHMVSLYT
jgi:hypothetical protein